MTIPSAHVRSTRGRCNAQGPVPSFTLHCSGQGGGCSNFQTKTELIVSWGKGQASVRLFQAYSSKTKLARIWEPSITKRCIG